MAAEDTFGLDLFDETATAVGSFPQTLRGYDRGAVDAYVREVESQLARAKAQLRQQHRQLTEASARAGDTDHAKLGSHTRSLLKAAESQAQELVTTAELRARQVLAKAVADAEATTNEAQLALDAASASSTAQLRDVRRRLSDQTAAELEAARAEAAAVREFARQQAAQLIADATARAELIAGEADLTAQARLVAAEREAAEHRRGVVAEKEAALAEVKATHDATTAELEGLLARTAQRVSEYSATLESEALTWEQRRDAGRAEAAEILAAARAESDLILREAADRARELRASILRGTEEQKAAVEAEITQLIGRRRAIVAQLGELSALAGSSATDFGDGEPPA